MTDSGTMRAVRAECNEHAVALREFMLSHAMPQLRHVVRTVLADERVDLAEGQSDRIANTVANRFEMWARADDALCRSMLGALLNAVNSRIKWRPSSGSIPAVIDPTKAKP